ncbi:MAG TPA: glycosyltransferase family 2 protein [Elusimicrobia bacterium]|nr:glycosyltransferase family 2 protein [Elusimicrobiota bacterium]
MAAERSAVELSLILATVGRREEFAGFLESLSRQTVGLRRFELIVVDQNDAIDLGPIISGYPDRMEIVHLRSAVKGLSHNRNIGLGRARGRIVAFPDDDCRYYPDTLERVLRAFDAEPDVGMVVGAIYDRGRGRPVVRGWPQRRVVLDRGNFFLLYASITMFSRRTGDRFDEDMGVGRYFGGYEDTDYVFRALSDGARCVFVPEVQVWHPDRSSDLMSPEVAASYGRGFGAFVAKNPCFPVLWLTLQVLGCHLAVCLWRILRGDREGAARRWAAFSSRISGWFRYRRDARSGSSVRS